MTEVEELNAIMEEVAEEPDPVVLEQEEEVHRGGHEQLTELQEDLREWRHIEEEEADREPQVREEPI